MVFRHFAVHAREDYQLYLQQRHNRGCSSCGLCWRDGPGSSAAAGLMTRMMRSCPPSTSLEAASPVAMAALSQAACAAISKKETGKDVTRSKENMPLISTIVEGDLVSVVDIVPCHLVPRNGGGGGAPYPTWVSIQKGSGGAAGAPAHPPSPPPPPLPPPGPEETACCASLHLRSQPARSANPLAIFKPDSPRGTRRPAAGL
jgi:hypothetical protein